MPVYATNVISFCASHRLHNPELSDEVNKQVFGKCNHVNSHGHNYKVEVTVTGEMDPKLGFFMNLTDLKAILVQVTDPLDHKRIDTDIEYFAKNNVVSTVENIAIYLWNEIEKLMPPNATLYKIKVLETEKNYAEYTGPN